MLLFLHVTANVYVYAYVYAMWLVCVQVNIETMKKNGMETDVD